VQSKFARKANLYGLKEVLHANARASQARRQLDAYLVKTWRPDPNNRVPREAEPFTRNSQESIQLLIGILIVKNRERVAAGRHVPEVDATAVGLNRLFQRRRVPLAIRKVLRIACEAGVDRSAMVSEPSQIHFDGGHGSRGRQQRNGKKGGGKSSHRPLAYQQLRDIAKLAAL